MRVKVFNQDEGGCGLYRLRWPAEACAAQGYDVTVCKFPQLITDGQKVLGLERNLDADVVVFQRPARLQYLRVFDYLQAQGVKVVVDMDDLLSQIHPMNPAFIPYQQPGGMHWMYADTACKMADLVTVTTPVLQEAYGYDDNALILPNCIPERYLSIEPKRHDDIIVVGWAGMTGTHPRDLQVTHGAINEAIAKRNDVRFLALGDDRTLENLGVRNKPPHGWQPGVNISVYAEFISQLDIGIVPLDNTQFNRAKSWLKALEYASVGVCPVVTPTPDNMRMVEAGAALAATTPNEWRDQIRLLIEDHQARQDLSKRTKEFAAQNTIEGNASKWWNAWTA